MKARARRLLPMLAMALLAACGGGEGDSGFTPTSPTAPTTPTTPGISYTPGVYPAASTFANQCQVPRTGTDPSTGQRYPDTQGSSLAEKHFLRSWTNESLSLVQRGGRPGSGLRPCRARLLRHAEDHRRAAQRPQQGRVPLHLRHGRVLRAVAVRHERGLRNQLGSRQGSVPPRQLVVQYVQAGTQAAAAGVTRGAEVLRVDGVDLVNDSTQAGVNTINSALFDPVQGSAHSLVFRDRGHGRAAHRFADRRCRYARPGATGARVAHGVGQPGLPAVQRSHRHGGEAAGRRHQPAACLERAGPGARPALQRRRVPGHRERAGLHDRRPGAHRRPDIRAHFVQQQAPVEEPGDRGSADAAPVRRRIDRPLGALGPGPPDPEPGARLRADHRRHLFGQRVDHQRPARRGCAR